MIDFGCGTGTLALAATEVGISTVILVENDEAQLEGCRARLQAFQESDCERDDGFARYVYSLLAVTLEDTTSTEAKVGKTCYQCGEESPKLKDCTICFHGFCVVCLGDAFKGPKESITCNSCTIGTKTQESAQ